MPNLALLFTVTDCLPSVVGTGVHIWSKTDAPCHLWLRRSPIQPKQHAQTVLRRGVRSQTEIYYCFDSFSDFEQNEPGDTTEHTWDFPDWTYCNTFWFYFIGTIAGIPSPSETCIFEYHNNTPCEDITVDIPALGYTAALWRSGTNWTTIRNYTTGYATHNVDYVRQGCSIGGSTRYLYRMRMQFDTHSIPLTAVIKSASVNIWFKQLTYKYGTRFLYLLTGTGLVHETKNEDYGAVGQNTTQVATPLNMNNLTTTEYTQFQLNTDGISCIKPEDYTFFSMRDDLDLLNLEPLDNIRELYVELYVTKTTPPSTHPPFLRITYTP